MGSLAATQYTNHLRRVTASLPASTRQAARISLADALQAASKLPKDAGHTLTVGAQRAFIDGIHLAVVVGALVAALSAVIVTRYLPRQLSAGSMHGPAEAMAGAAELGLAGIPPVFPDDQVAFMPEGSTSSGLPRSPRAPGGPSRPASIVGEADPANASRQKPI
jgi:hypothetical protein